MRIIRIQNDSNELNNDQVEDDFDLRLSQLAFVNNISLFLPEKTFMKRIIKVFFFSVFLKLHFLLISRFNFRYESITSSIC